MTDRIALCSAALAAALLAAAAAADTAILTPSKDNTLYEDPGGILSNGHGEYSFVGRTASHGSRRGLTEFNLSSIPAGSTISSVVLRMHMSRTNSGSKSVELHRVLTNWGESAFSDAGSPGGSGTLAENGDATWLHTFYNQDPGLRQFWTHVGGDFIAASSASIGVGGIGFYSWGSTIGMLADVQGWVNNPTANFGWLLLGIESDGRSTKRFDSRENLTTENQPRLTVMYTPEPAGGLALLLGAGLLNSRRCARHTIPPQTARAGGRAGARPG